MRKCVVICVAAARDGLGLLLAENLNQAPAGDPRIVCRTFRWFNKSINAVMHLCATRIQRAFRAHSLPAQVRARGAMCCVLAAGTEFFPYYIEQNRVSVKRSGIVSGF